MKNFHSTKPKKTTGLDNVKRKAEKFRNTSRNQNQKRNQINGRRQNQNPTKRRAKKKISP